MGGGVIPGYLARLSGGSHAAGGRVQGTAESYVTDMHQGWDYVLGQITLPLGLRCENGRNLERSSHAPPYLPALGLRCENGRNLERSSHAPPYLRCSNLPAYLPCQRRRRSACDLC